MVISRGILVTMGQIIHPTPISYGDIDLSWVVGRHVSAVSLHEPIPWVFGFGAGSAISVECLWRIVERGRIVLCSDDHGHQFGLPAPVDGIVRARELLAGPIMSARLREATADLIIEFEGDRSLEIIPTSAGYDSWQMSTPSGRSYVATGGGRIDTWLSDEGKYVGVLAPGPMLDQMQRPRATGSLN